MAEEPYEPNATLEEKREALTWALGQLHYHSDLAWKRNKHLGPKAAEVVMRQYRVHARALRQVFDDLRPEPIR